MDHAGLDAMVMRSKSHVWIIAARRLAKVIKNNCFFCKRLFKVTGEQIMAPLPEHRMGPAPVFSSTAVDLFSPLTFNGTVNKRSTAKAWGVVFVCTATSLVHVEITESYSTEAFLLALRRFMSLHGEPKRFQSDQGTQLVAASKQVASWDWSKIHQFADGAGVDWQAVPTGGQHFNGQAERIIGPRQEVSHSNLGRENMLLWGIVHHRGRGRPDGEQPPNRQELRGPFIRGPHHTTPPAARASHRGSASGAL